MQVTLDFETRSHADLVKLGLHAYASHPSTEVLCVAWKVEDGAVKVSRTIPQELLDLARRADCVFCAWNAEFEMEIWNKVFCPSIPLPPSKFRCAMARSMACALPPALGTAAALLKVSEQKDAEGAKIMRLMCKPDKNGKFVWNTEYQEKLESYCKQDVEAEYQCELKLPHLSPTEQKLWEITARINSEGLKVDRDACEAAVALLTEHSDRLETEIDMLTGGNVRTGKQVQKMLDQFKTWGFTINDMTKDSITEALKSPDLTPEVKRLLELRAEGSRSSVAKYQKFLTMMGADDRVRGLLRYHGASTGRWSGSGIQPQNFPRGTIKNVTLIIETMKLRDYKLLDSLYPSVSEAASAALRGMIVADNEFFDGDFSAIEARVLVWCAGARTQLADYHAGVDTYKKMASKIYRIPADRVNDFPQRQLGKAAVLGAGYGMGAEKFIDAAKSYGVVVDEALAKHAITTFREENPEVTKLWYDVETAAKNAVKFPGQVYSAGKCKLKSANGHLRIQLPSARVLTFPFAKLALKETKFGIREELRFTGLFQGKPVPESTYGGKIVENCLGASSPILTKRGWVAIASIRPDDELWDGLEWVKHKGLVYQGMKEVIQWWGLEVTPDHKILDGKTWRSAINLEGFALIDALKTGRSLITLRLWKPTKLGACIIQNSYAAAVDNIELKLNKCAKSLMARVRNAEKKRGTAANTFISLRPKFSKYGPTGIAALCADALNPSAPNTETTGHVEYGSTKSGLPTVKPFLPTPKLSRIGITVLSTLTALIMTGITLPVIFAWWTAAPTLLTSAILLDTLLMVVCGHLKNYGRGSSRNGVASTQSHGTLKTESHYKKFGAITYAPVFDLMDSGPRRRFTVLTSVGPVIAHNCVQAIARDLMAFAMINLDNAGLKPVLTVHDEILVDSPDSSRFAEFQEIMERVPEWGEGIPLKVGAWRGKRFRK